jgi:hypothetical protein
VTQVAGNGVQASAFYQEIGEWTRDMIFGRKESCSEIQLPENL